MKTRATIILGISALVALSFSFVTIPSNKIETLKTEKTVTITEPVGGFVSEDKL